MITAQNCCECSSDEFWQALVKA